MYFIGDIHGRFETYEYMITKMPLKNGIVGMDCSIQLGDMGIGFPYGKKGLKSISPDLGSNHTFLRGNHDSPRDCEAHPRYLGDFGYNEITGIFHISGAFSIDKIHRTPYINWWPDEEFTYSQQKACMEMYQRIKPRYVCSHECPLDCYKYVCTNGLKYEGTSSTAKFLSNLLEIHSPEYWIHGHHHNYVEYDVKNTHFVSLSEVIYRPLAQCYYHIHEIKGEKP